MAIGQTPPSAILPACCPTCSRRSPLRAAAVTRASRYSELCSVTFRPLQLRQQEGLNAQVFNCG